MSEFAIETVSLTKRFGSIFPVVDHLDLKVPRGTLFGLLGRNGAGKTTLIRMLMGLVTPTEGEAWVFGRSMETASIEHRARVAYVAQQHELFPHMTAEELCFFFSHLYPRWDQSYAIELIGRFGVPWDSPRYASLSVGQKRQLALILALASGSELLILDEPAAGLDPVARRLFISALMELSATEAPPTVFLSTHILSDLEGPADQIGILEYGKLVLSGSTEDLRRHARRVQAVFPTAVPTDLEIPGAHSLEIEGRVATAVLLSDDEDGLRLLRQSGAQVDVFPLDLEQLFISVTTRGDAA